MDEWLLLSMYSLAVTEFWNGLPQMWTGNTERCARAISITKDYFDTCWVHLNAPLCALVVAGGWDRSDPYVLDSDRLVDKYISIYTTQLPIIPLSWGIIGSH